MRRRDSTHENTSKHGVKRSIWFRSKYPAILQQYSWMQFGVGCFDSKKIKAVQIKHLSAWDMISPPSHNNSYTHYYKKIIH